MIGMRCSFAEEDAKLIFHAVPKIFQICQIG